MAITFFTDCNPLKIVGPKVIAGLAVGFLSAAVLASQQRKGLGVEVQVLRECKPAEGASVWVKAREYRAGVEKIARNAGSQIVPASGGRVHFSLPADFGHYAVFAKNDREELGQGCFSLSTSMHGKITHENNRITLILKKSQKIQGQLFEVAATESLSRDRTVEPRLLQERFARPGSPMR